MSNADPGIDNIPLLFVIPAKGGTPVACFRGHESLDYSLRSPFDPLLRNIRFGFGLRSSAFAGMTMQCRTPETGTELP